MLHCTPAPGQKSEKKTTSSSSSSSTLAGAAVEKKIIDSKRSTASPVDMILKKLTEKVQSSPSPSSAILSPVSSPGSNYKFFKSKDEKSADPAKKSVDAANMKDHIKSCHDKQISVKMKNISQTEIQKSPTTGKSKSPKSPMKSSDSKAAPVSSPKKPEKKESSKAPSLKSPPLKSNAKSPKSKEQVVKPPASTKKSPAGRPPAKKAKKRLSALSSDSETDSGKAKKKRKSYTEDSDSDDDSEFEVKKKRKPTLYCFESCFEEESNEMIG